MSLLQEADFDVCVACLPQTNGVCDLPYADQDMAELEQNGLSIPIAKVSTLESNSGHRRQALEIDLSNLKVRPSTASLVRRRLQKEKYETCRAISISGLVFSALGWGLLLAVL